MSSLTWVVLFDLKGGGEAIYFKEPVSPFEYFERGNRGQEENMEISTFMTYVKFLIIWVIIQHL